MAEKKPGFFSRLFGGKKQKETEKTVVESSSIETNVEATNENVAPILAENKALEETYPHSQDDSTSVEIINTIAEEIVTEAKENFQRDAHKDDSSTSTDSDRAEIPLKAQHNFIEEIAVDAKEAIQSHSTNEATTATIAEEKEDQSINLNEKITASSTEASTNITKPAKENNTLDSTPLQQPFGSHADEEVSIPATVVAEPMIETASTEATISHSSPESHQTAERPTKKPGFFARLSQKLSKTRNNLTEGLADLFLGKKEINEEILEELETRLLMADVGINVTTQLLDQIRDSVSRKSLSNVDELFAALKVQMKEILEPVSKPLVIDTTHQPYVLLMIGVNGVGKTTTIGKLAKKFQNEGKSVMLAAGDTFRAAAVEQLEVWGERNHIPVVSQKEGADPASVIFDAMESAKAKKIDILIADTAGRLHTDSGLMQELAKINRVIKRHDESAPHEVMLVVDASTGQNALNQAKQFNETIPLSGITFTKLDGTAKGGIIFAIAEELKIPIRFIGVGETIDDLRPFNAEEFVDALIGEPEA